VVSRDGRTPPGLRLRATAAPLVALPWQQPLLSWSPASAPVLDVPLGASRHVVRIVHTGDRLWALKEMPRWAVEREYAALAAMERRGVPAVRPAGLVTRDAEGGAVLITEFQADSVLWRTLLADLPADGAPHHARVSEAVAVFLVDLHRQGVFWGDCSLANLLFRRDGQGLQPVLVDAETAEVRPALTDGQRRHDLEILQDNLAGGLLDLAAEQQRQVDPDEVADRTHGVSARYAELWEALHEEQSFPFVRRHDAVAEVDRLNRLGYAVDEVRLTSVGAGWGDVRLHTVVAHRRHHADEILRLTGLQVGEGQARVLLDDLRSHGRSLPVLPELEVARSWLDRSCTRPSSACVPCCRDPVTRCRTTATCWRSAGCSASEPATTSGTRLPCTSSLRGAFRRGQLLSSA
jgi:tRNA A-37 threonylcarbamoyl transferase component Bud32